MHWSVMSARVEVSQACNKCNQRVHCWLQQLQLLLLLQLQQLQQLLLLLLPAAAIAQPQ
jgi:hypothetical protein